MFKNHLKIAWRNLLKNKVSSVINIGGLAIGLVVTMLIGLWIADEFNYNHYFKNKDKIAQVYQSQRFNGAIETNKFVPVALESKLKDQYGDSFEHIIMSSGTNSRYLNYGDKSISRLGNFMQPGAPELLNLEMIKGKYSGLEDINSIMLSESTAKALFGNEEPLGKIIITDKVHNMLITGIYKDIPRNNTFYDTKFIMPFTHLMATRWSWLKNPKDDWSDNFFQLFVKLTNNVNVKELSEKIRNIKKEVSPETAQYNPQLMLLPMNDWYLHSSFENGVQSGGRIENIWIFGSIGLFVLFLACINFMNLSTARSEKRALEVGVRKSIGSTRGQLIHQFLIESFLVVLLAFGVAIIMTLLFLNGFNALAKKEILFPWGNFQFWTISLFFIVITALLSGSYPALYLSSFKPIKVMKGTYKAGKFAALPRKILVVTQFTVSIILIIGTMIVMQQIAVGKDRPIGYEKSGLIQIPTDGKDFSGKYKVMREAFLSSNTVTEMSWASGPTTQVWTNDSGYTWEGKPAGFKVNFAMTGVSHDYIKSVKMKIIKGRDFSREFATDSHAVILNKTAVAFMGLKDPIGKLIGYENNTYNNPPLKIIGVVDDMVTESPYQNVKPHMYQFGYGTGGFYHLRLNPDQSIRENLAVVKQTFKTHFPHLPFQYDFVDQKYAEKFEAEERIASLARIFAILAILISCLGLFGLVSFVAEQRTKEIGVRKILGATVTSMWLLLSKDFVQLVIIALLIASPIAYYFMQGWIEKFAYRAEITIWIFVAAGFCALVLTCITVSFQAIKAATANPIKSLRTE